MTPRRYPRQLVSPIEIDSTSEPYNYVFTSEYEVFEWNRSHIANYAELSNLMMPRAFIVEQGHGVGEDEWALGNTPRSAATTTNWASATKPKSNSSTAHTRSTARPPMTSCTVTSTGQSGEDSLRVASAGRGGCMTEAPSEVRGDAGLWTRQPVGAITGRCNTDARRRAGRPRREPVPGTTSKARRGRSHRGPRSLVRP